MPDLPRHTLGRTGLQVTTLGFGSLELRGMVRRRRPATHGWPAGAHPARGPGRRHQLHRGRRRLRRSRRAHRPVHRQPPTGVLPRLQVRVPAGREQVLAARAHQVRHALPRLHDYSRRNIIDALHQSLRRLKTDYLDVLQFHFSPAKEVLEHERAIQTLADLKRAGKIRFLGCSSILPNLTDHIGMGVFDVLQIPYSALQPEHQAVIAEAAKAGAGIVIRGGVARGWCQGFATLCEPMRDPMPRTRQSCIPLQTLPNDVRADVVLAPWPAMTCVKPRKPAGSGGFFFNAD